MDKTIEIQFRVFGENGGQWDDAPTVPVIVPDDVDPLRLDLHVALIGMAWNLSRAHGRFPKIAIMRYLDPANNDIRTVMPSTIFRYPKEETNDIQES